MGTPRRTVDPSTYWSARGSTASRIAASRNYPSKRVAVFDFDQTLAADEITIWGWENIVDRGFGGPERVSMLKDMLESLNERHIACAIVSFNTKATIERALSAINLLIYFRRDLIFGRDNVKWPLLGWKKSTVILKSVLIPLSLGEADLFFADDDPNNIRDVVTALPKANALHIPRVGTATPFVAHVARPLGGMQRVHVERVLSWIKGEDSASTAASASTASASTSAACARIAEAAEATGSADAPAESDRDGGAASRSGPCDTFVPKRPSGPLANRCFTCGHHLSLHPETVNAPAAAPTAAPAAIYSRR